MRKWYEFSEKDIGFGMISFLLMPFLILPFVGYLSSTDCYDGENILSSDKEVIYKITAPSQKSFFNEVKNSNLSITPFFDFPIETYDSSEYIIEKIAVDSDTIAAQIKFLKGDSLFKVISIYAPPNLEISEYIALTQKYFQAFDSVMVDNKLSKKFTK
jgi:hypothetical protein